MEGRPFIEQLESLEPDEVRRKLSAGEFGDVDSPSRNRVEAWLKLKVESLSEAREEESLSISRKALRNSERATRIAISAIILSISMAILAIIQWYSK